MGKVEETIEKIMQATVRVASDRGFSNTRTADIAKEAGVSEGLIFKYFPTKKKLFALIVKDNFKRLKSGVETIIDDATLTATGKVNALIDFHFDFFANHHNIVHLMLGSERKSIDDMEPIIEYAIKPYIQLVARILKEGIIAGEFRPFNVEVIALAVIGTIQLNLIATIVSRNVEEFEAMRIEVKDYILSGIRAAN